MFLYVLSYDVMNKW